MPPSSAKQHAEWLSLIGVSGPFLSLGTLVGAFPQGLDAHDPEIARDLRRAHGEWEDEGATDPAIHSAWVDFVLGRVLELPDEVRRRGQDLPATLSAPHESGETLRPDELIVDPDSDSPRLLITRHRPGQDLDAPPADGHSAASPIERMERLCAGTGVRLGLVTNGERWTLIDSTAGATTSRATWYATFWLEEQLTLRAFRSLLGVGRFFSVPEAETLEALMARSAEDQQTVTDQLGTQVRRAVEMLVHALDLADRTRDRSLLREVPDQEVYEACLTVMMRLVVLLSAEERDLLLLGDDLWDDSYAIGTLRARLRAEADANGEEVLERRRDAWPRLLATFRAVYGGVSHGSLRLPAYGGNLLDPDRFPFLEGRPHGTDWRSTAASPLPVDNRTVLHLLDALQQLEVKVPGGTETRDLSFRGLDVEQIGHVYEGLLDHTAFRTSEPALALLGKKEPELALRLIEEQAERGWNELVAYLVEQTGLSAKGVAKRLDAEPDDLGAQRLLVACEGDEELRERVLPYAGLIRADSFGYPLVFPEGALFVTEDPRRRNTGTHYTPPSLTEPIVRYALEPVVYEGPAEGWEREKWRLKTPAELFDLKVADIAMGSGAFLVQACRYLAERLLEAWEAASADDGPRTSPEAQPSFGAAAEALIPDDPAERLIYARRLIASRCLYGVDKDPMAVEMAKLSLWLVTLQKDRPFTFLDHALRCGDSLLGITSIAQLTDLNPDPGEAAGTLSVFAQPVLEAVERASALRASIEGAAPLDAAESEAKARALTKAEAITADLRLVADLIVGADLGAKDYRATMAISEADVRELLTNGHDVARTRLRRRSQELLNVDRPAMEADRRPFHWALEFPEVFATDGRKRGFGAIVGNPPFLGGKKVTPAVGGAYRRCLIRRVATGRRGNADLGAYFVLRATQLIARRGVSGLVLTNSITEGETREVALDALVDHFRIVRALTSRPWPGLASLEIVRIWFTAAEWRAPPRLDGNGVQYISPRLQGDTGGEDPPAALSSMAGIAGQGPVVLGMGFVLEPVEATKLIADDRNNGLVLRPYLNGMDLNRRPDQSPSRWVINFFDWPIERAAQFPSVYALVVARVKPEREQKTQRQYRERWWQYSARQERLMEALGRCALPLARTIVSNTHALVAIDRTVQPSHAVACFALDSWGQFASLQSSVHEAWVWHQASSMRTDVRYTPTDCFETFPLPDPLPPGETGRLLHDFRAERTRARDEGLTKLANRINDPAQNDDDLARLRELMVTMDQEVAAAYGWNDLDLDHGFHDTKLGRRFTIGPEARQEILDRLLELNHERYADEVRRGLHEKKTKAGK
jgi:hypothetical protein